MSNKELISHCESIYLEKGISSLSYPNFPRKLYFVLYRRGISLKKLINLLELEQEYLEFRIAQKLWSWKKIVSEANKIVKKEGFLPPAEWFRENSLSGLVFAVYGLGKTWGDLRNEFHSFEHSTFVMSRNGLRWLSHAEASLSNFLFARGIIHRKGRKYPDDYSTKTGLKYGMYDLEFQDLKNKWIFVEVWGEKPLGHQEKKYAYKKHLKEEYNKNNVNFLGINFRDCYNEPRLESILKPFIGKIKPFVFKKQFDSEIPSTHWSNVDEMLTFCIDLAKKQPKNIFPTEEWLRKRGKWKNRPGESYNTLAVYIKTWVGGIRKLRSLLGQPENSTVSWSKELVLSEFKSFYNKYGLTPGTVRTRFRRGQINISKKEAKYATNLDHAILVYFGGTPAICKKLNIKR